MIKRTFFIYSAHYCKLHPEEKVIILKGSDLEIHFPHDLIQTLIFGPQFCFRLIYDSSVTKQERKTKISANF